MSSTRTPKRTGLDEYQTPEPAIRTLATFIAPHIYKTDSWAEPFKGNGNIIRVLQPYFTGDADWCEIKEGRDYFEVWPNRSWGWPSHISWIITNPPFSRAQEAIQKSLQEAENVAYLLRLNFLGSQKRRSFWQEHPPSTLLVLPERPSFVEKVSYKEVKGKTRRVVTKTDSIEYAWFIWSNRVPRGIFVR